MRRRVSSHLCSSQRVRASSRCDMPFERFHSPSQRRGSLKLYRRYRRNLYRWGLCLGRIHRRPFGVCWWHGGRPRFRRNVFRDTEENIMTKGTIGDSTCACDGECALDDRVLQERYRYSCRDVDSEVAAFSLAFIYTHGVCWQHPACELKCVMLLLPACIGAGGLHVDYRLWRLLPSSYGPGYRTRWAGFHLRWLRLECSTGHPILCQHQCRAPNSSEY